MNRIIVLWLFSMILSGKSICQDLHLTGISSTYTQIGRINKQWTYTVNILSIYNTSNLTINNKIFPSGHTHFVPHLLFNKKLTDKFNIGVGYAWGRHNIFGLREDEHRLMAQGVYMQKFKNITLSHRGRFEYRSPLNLKTDIRSNASIFRYQIGATIPLYNPKETKKGFYVLASNESFLYLNGATNGPVSSKNGPLYAENWANVGIGYTNKTKRFEIGYGYQTLVRNTAQDKRVLSLVQLAFTTNIKWDDVQLWWYL
jgi:Protein of unknown function (DUF2490)